MSTASHKQLLNVTSQQAREEKSTLAVVSLCFLLSGFAALLYQAAWLKKLAVVFGTSDLAVATVLSAYMGGLALGAAIAARFVHRIRRPVLVYGVLEAIIGGSALAVPSLLEGAQHLLVAVYGNQPHPVSANGLGQTAYYLLATFVILAIPTAAMGATLPLLSRYAVREERQIGPRIGLLYGINTLGAVLGALFAGFVLLPHLGLIRTLYVGVAINLAVFALAVQLARTEGAHRSSQKNFEAVGKRPPLHGIMPIMAVSGFVSFVLEVFWTRLLSHIFGGTVYAFSIMLACFLTGIALGSMVAGRWAGTRSRAHWLFALAQVLIAVFSFVSYWVLGRWIPDAAGLGEKALFAFVIIVPATLFIGATYPLAVRIATGSAAATANVSGRIYSWNTAGAISGALMAGFFLLPVLGFGLTLKLVMCISVALAFLSMVMLKPRTLFPMVAVGVIFLIIVTLVNPSRPDRLINAHLSKQQAWGEEHYFGVGRSATVLMREVDGFMHLSSNGLSESVIGRAGTPPANLSQKWLAALPTLARPDARSMLIIGFGGGVALEGVPPQMMEIDVIELEPEMIRASEAIASLRGTNVLEDPRLRIIFNDARNALTLTRKKYDIIVSQPSHPWTGGAAHLYTSEFLALAKSRLSPDGVYLQWINAQFLDEALLKTLMATLTEQFSEVELYQPERQELLFLASEAAIDVWSGQAGAATALQRARRHYNRLGLRAVEDAVAMMSLDVAGVRDFAGNAQLNTDDRNRLAFFSRSRGDGLTADTLQELFGPLDPLTNPGSDFHTHESRGLAMHHIGTQLLQANFIQRTSRLARAIAEPDVRMTIDALGFEHTGESSKARNAFNRALAENPANTAAQLGLLRQYLGELGGGRIPPDIAKLANRQTGPDRRVLEGWVFGAAGAFDRLAALDSELAAVPATSLLFPIAVKLRVDWRVVRSRASADEAIAREAMALLDDLLASYWSMDLFILRSGCALLAGDNDAFIESAAAAVRQAKARLEQAESGRELLSPEEAGYLALRLESLSQPFSGPIAALSGGRANEVAGALAEVVSRLHSLAAEF